MAVPVKLERSAPVVEAPAAPEVLEALAVRADVALAALVARAGLGDAVREDPEDLAVLAVADALLARRRALRASGRAC